MAVRLRFRDCVLDTGVRVVTRHGEPVRLSPKAFGLLEILAAERPNAISHTDLRQRLWPDTVMGGTTLARLVSEARAAIGDADGSEVIRTVHRFGYAFSGTVTEEPARDTRRGGSAEVSRWALRWGTHLVPLASGENVIGRSPDALITLPSSKVSRRHARVLVSDGRALLEDLDSRNGTYVGDRRIESPVELKNGDRIGIGPALLIFCAATDDGLTSVDTVKRLPRRISRTSCRSRLERVSVLMKSSVPSERAA